MTGAPLFGKEFAERLNATTTARLADHRFGVSALAREMEMSRSTLFLDWLTGKLPKSGNSFNWEIKNPIDDINLEDDS